MSVPHAMQRYVDTRVKPSGPPQKHWTPSTRHKVYNLVIFVNSFIANYVEFIPHRGLIRALIID